ncbi:MAG TPA: 2-oxoglutarate dehydrogenase complex dihydrolipoyllysine-residue succinyltransferase [Bacteroidales bacterium]|nr:2-oxoglutarate dehydrogenase complex dihydrolipoyllysine-residue succinyltransferase [Bacteroidales bacterium]HSA43884.1 2-oxoglutarate dehydrogenase complex dihydrolipoyllysine-residue succinyltransferase [Bacteroidales bacterium]
MTTIEVKVPSPGESITQVQLAAWLVKDGDYVETDQELAEIDSDKATLAIAAPAAGKCTLMAAAGDSLPVGAVICMIDTEAIATDKAGKAPEPEALKESPTEKETAVRPTEETDRKIPVTPLAKSMLSASGIDQEQAIDWLKKTRISSRDVQALLNQRETAVSGSSSPSAAFSREVEHKKMSSLRIKLSERLVAVKNQTAMLTTFNEVDMSKLLEIKNNYQEKFRETHGVSVGLMSFFTKAVSIALREFPMVNARIEGDEFILPGYVDMGIAVSAPKGLVVPVIRNAESLSLARIEATIKELAGKARNNKISLEEMTGGTFTITNGGVFGSMMSTPVLNPPQSAILGMHAIMDRPVARDGQVVIRPMMYLALSYDHRVIDGKESVSFLVKVKELIEDPVSMLVEGKDPISVLLGLQ